MWRNNWEKQSLCSRFHLLAKHKDRTMIVGLWGRKKKTKGQRRVEHCYKWPCGRNGTLVPVLARVRVFPSGDRKLPFVKPISFGYSSRDNRSTSNSTKQQSRDRLTKGSPSPLSTGVRSEQVSMWDRSSCFGTKWRALNGQDLSSLSSWGWFCQYREHFILIQSRDSGHQNPNQTSENQVWRRI